jgi:hypothetical protein
MGSGLATSYPTLSKSINEHIESICVFDNRTTERGVYRSRAKWVDVVTSPRKSSEIFRSGMCSVLHAIITRDTGPSASQATRSLLKSHQERR